MKKFAFALILSAVAAFAFAQDAHGPKKPEAQHPQQPAEQKINQAPGAAEAHPTTAESHPATAEAGHPAADHADPCAAGQHVEKEFNAGENAVHHIADANTFHVIGDFYVPLPVILKDRTAGWKMMMSSAFHPHHHGTGELAIDRFVLNHGEVMRVRDDRFPEGEVKIGNIFSKTEIDAKGKERENHFVCANGQVWPLDKKTTYDGGLMGGGVTSFSDFSITKNVFTMILGSILLFFGLGSVARSYKKRDGKAPTGFQNFLEPIITFVTDEVAKPNIGPKYEKYVPFLLSVFFFILGLNLIGQIPFFPGSANVTGNISVTIVLAIIGFIITMLSTNKHFWEHTLWMPGVPAVLKILILTPIEILGVILKPFTLLLRLFANITAGHIVILSFVSLIFILGKSGQSTGGTAAGIIASVPLTLFMMTLELLVAFLQAYIFTMLSASYIGAAVEEGHHAEHH